MEHLLSVWPRVAEQLEDAKNVLLLADYDGTLTPIVERPELANLSEDVRQLLQSLSCQRLFTVGVISGRALADLKNKARISGIIHAGNHGLEIEGLGVSFTHPLAAEISPVIRVMRQVLKRSLGTIKGVLVEDKGLTLSVHYRQVDGRKTKEVKSIFERIVSGAQTLGRIRITQGKRVYEIRPAVAWDKGKAIKLLMKRYGKGGRRSGLLPIYLGDDLTDEDAFRAIEAYGTGISVFVGDAKQDTLARYFLKSPAEVAEFLSLVLEHTRRTSRENKVIVLSKDGQWLELENCFLVGAVESPDKVGYHEFLFGKYGEETLDEMLEKAEQFLIEQKKEAKDATG